jgi:hypothetical protein
LALRTEKEVEGLGPVFDPHELVGQVAFLQAVDRHLGIVRVIFNQQDFHLVPSRHAPSSPLGRVK